MVDERAARGEGARKDGIQVSDANSRKRAPGRGSRRTGPSAPRRRARTQRREAVRPAEAPAVRPETATPTATATADVPPAGDPRPASGTVRAARIRRFLFSAAGVHGVALLLIVSVAVVGVTIAGGGFTPMPATIASLWMLLNLAPFGYAGTDVGLVPALPAMIYFAAVAWKIRREVAGPVSIRDVRTMAAVFLGVPLALTLITWLMLVDASGVLRIDAPSLPHALASTAAIHAATLVVGMGPRLCRALLRRRKLPEWPLSSLRLALEFVGFLWAAGAVAVLASMAWHHAAVAETLGIADGAAALTGLVALSIAYLPNIAIAAAGILVGATANVGTAEAGLFAVHRGTLPPLPTLAAMPQSHLSAAFGVLLAVPVAIAVWCVHRHLRREVGRPYVEVVTAAVFAGLIVALLAALMGGELGVYGWSGTNWWLAGVLSSVWLVVPGAIVAIAVSGFPGTGAAEAPAPVRDDATAAAAEAGREDEAVDADDADDSDDADEAGEVETADDADEAGEADDSDDAGEAGDNGDGGETAEDGEREEEPAEPAEEEPEKPEEEGEADEIGETGDADETGETGETGEDDAAEEPTVADGDDGDGREGDVVKPDAPKP